MFVKIKKIKKTHRDVCYPRKNQNRGPDGRTAAAESFDAAPLSAVGATP